jgi:hypothetical protein
MEAVVVAGRFWRFYERANDVVRTFTGPAQIGAGHPEGPDIRSADAPCPICHRPMSLHEVERQEGQREASRLYCPA